MNDYKSAGGYQPTNPIGSMAVPTRGPAYTPVKKDIDEVVRDLVDANTMMLSVISQLGDRVSSLERKVLELMAAAPDGNVTDDDQPEFDWDVEDN